MGRARYVAETNSPRRLEGSGRPKRITRNYALPQSDRPNPHNAPRIVLDAADSSLTDTLEVILGWLEGLPDGFRSSLRKYFDAQLIDEEFRDLVNALLKLRKGEELAVHELHAVTGPKNFLRELAEGLREAGEDELIPPQLAMRIETDIIPAILGLEASFANGTLLEISLDLWKHLLLDSILAPENIIPDGTILSP
jgi:hypothetical protein